MLDALVRLFGPFRAPPDQVGWAALGVAAVFLYLAARAPKSLTEGSTRRFLVLGAAAAALLSLGYAAVYLRGGPRIIDATTYWLQARSLAEGFVSFPIPDAAASFRGRFLFGAEPGHLAGIFPPGYPLLLAIGFKLDAPMLIGPLLAGGIVVGTYRLTREIAMGVPSLAEDQREIAARGAALFSIACAALRYHTADTMSHGAVALLVTFALARALRANREDARAFFGVGLLVGYVALTRPVSAIPIGGVALLLAWRSTERGRAVARLALGIVPGIALLLAFQRAATGSFFTPTQTAYYAVSDGPPGCFRWGFGDGIGCMYEHGDFVRARLANGYGLFAALGTTVRRLHAHLGDAFAGWPLTFALLGVLAFRRSRPRALAIPAALVGAQILAYLPFYFDGDYPGGGARFFADVIPVEHSIVAVALASAAPLAKDAARRVWAVLAAAAVLFATHGVYAHRSLAEREGGAPMWDEQRAKDGGAERGLVFVDTDHAFNLAFDPAAAERKTRVVARLRGDDHDRILYERLGTPQSFLFRWTDGTTPATLGSYVPPQPRNESGIESWRFEGESMWPPLAQTGGYAIPEWRSEGCASGGRVLLVTPSGGSLSEIDTEVPIPHDGSWAIIPRVLGLGSDTTLTLFEGAKPVASWSGSGSGKDACRDLDAAVYWASGVSALRLQIQSKAGASETSGPFGLDRVVVERR